MAKFSTPPQVPNWQPGNGSRLVTERIDFEAHLEGINFRHLAPQIDLAPDLTIFDGYQDVTVYNVQDALTLLGRIVSPPDINQATTASLGIVQLAGDIGGVATSVLVKGLQGRPINTGVPVSGQVLTWTGGAWGPATPANSVTFSGDLQGNNAGPQQVIGITGVLVGGIYAANVHCNYLFWDAVINATGLSQFPTSTGNAATMSVQAQSSTVGLGGNLILSGGNGSEVPGIVILQDGASNQMIQLGNFSGRFTALNLPGTAGSGDMPSGTGDLVTLINNASSIPTAGSSDGPIIYGNNGNLWVMQSGGTAFQVGSIPNPSTWGTTPSGFAGASFTDGGFTYTARTAVSTSNASPSTGNLLIFTIPNNVTARVDAIIIGRNTANGDTAQFNLSIGYTNYSGTTSAVGTLTNADPRYSGAASSWTTSPTINNSSNSVRITSGGNGSTTINWTASVQLILG